MRQAFLVLIFSVTVLAGCAATPPPEPAGVQGEGKAPTSKEVLQYVFRNHDVSLSADSSCSGVGTTPEDRTIGDYLSGFLAGYADETGKNWLEISTKPVPGPVPAWECWLIIRRADDEDESGWGVSFVVSGAAHSVRRDSFRCIGGG